MATVFWDCHGIVLIDYLPKGATVSGAYYSNLLDRVSTRLRAFRPGLSRKKLLLLHDNASPHTCDFTATTLAELGIDVLPHPAYSPDLAPSDFFLFTGLKKHLAGTRFASDEEVIQAVNAYFDTKTPEFFYTGLHALEHRYERCIALRGEYTE